MLPDDRLSCCLVLDLAMTSRNCVREHYKALLDRMPGNEERANEYMLVRVPSTTFVLFVKHISEMANHEQEPLLPDENLDQPVESRDIEDDAMPETATYGRNLGWNSAYVLVISRVIGSGIFATPGSITKSVGSIGLSLLLWVAGAILAACGLAISLEYGCMLPRSGGEKVYLEFTYRHPRFLASTLVAVQAVVLGFTASNCIVFGRYTIFAFGLEPTEFTQKALAVGLLTLITIIHSWSVKTGIVIQDALGWVKIVLILFMIFSGLYVVIFQPENAIGTTPGIDVFAWDKLFKDSNWSLGIITTALFKVFYSYAGLSNLNNVLNEVKDPVRTLKSVSPTALLTTCILYTLINVAYFVVIPLDEIKASGELIAALFFEKMFGAGFGKTILPLAVATSAAGNVMVVTFALVGQFTCVQFMFADVRNRHGSTKRLHVRVSCHMHPFSHLLDLLIPQWAD